ncbi:glutamate-5-semialdehyde dehydrogenase [Desulfohalotomaculum tongense]|uniref:glutamate-5-semialdehyde dehydrogenase n=1 Tax=Desulforadius tongensis TaxID=1216062 RepID=UPI0019571B2A|nr:glutamate-5-semialdehyde dehydrogenase [Desulforadius tongensis]MBM7856223.1 glutamate-5-semialdehyde dehydrogenase [Desulforadius tongensis]
MHQELLTKARMAKEASRSLAYISTGAKNKALLAMADSLEKKSAEILQANARDMEAAAEKGITGALLDRLRLTEARVAEMANGLREVARLPDPVGEMLSMWRRPNGLEIGQMRVPLGVVGIIYEARPNVTVDAAALCLKAGNAVLLRGGSEAINSNLAIAGIISKAAQDSGLPEGTITILEDTSRSVVNEMMKLNDYIDVLIPRGGAGLIKAVVENATVPVIETGVGNCHVYVDQYADLDKARAVVVNAKCQRPGVCNAAETLLVHKNVAAQFLPGVLEELRSRGVEVRGCSETAKIVQWVKNAGEEDFAAEFLDLIIAVRVVNDLKEALEHIYRYGTKHSESIITENYTAARQFLQRVDAAAVYVNASTRFTDGHQFGFGAEIGISTQKLHARGPMGLKELTTIKYVVYGDGQVRE